MFIIAMSFNMTKCKFMTVDKISDARNYTMNTSFGDFSILDTDQEIDLRVVFENYLKFINHVSQCIRKANRILNVIKHSFVIWIHVFIDYFTSIWLDSILTMLACM